MEPDLQEVLLHRLRNDDKAALRELFEQYYPYVCGSMLRLLPDKSTVEDLAQDVFVRFWNKRHDIQINSSLKAYLRRMAVNEALQYLRKKKFYQDEISEEQMSDTNPGVEQQYLDQELQERIRHAVETLPPRCRAVFELSRYESLSYKEIAERMDISIKTVENQMSKALKHLRSVLKHYLHLFF